MTKHANPPQLHYEVEWALLCAALLILGSSISFWLYKERSDIDVNERARLQVSAQVIDHNLVHQLKGMNDALESVLSEFPPESAAKSVTAAVRHLKALAMAMPGVRSMFILDKSGRLLAATWDKFTVQQDFSHREYFTTPRDGAQAGVMYVSTPFRNIADVYSLNVSRAAIGPDGKFAGVVTATLDPDYFNDALRSVLYAPDMMAALVHREGKVFVAQPDESQLLGKDFSMPGSSFNEHQTEGQIASIKSGMLYSSGERRLRAFRTVRSGDVQMDKPLVVVIGRNAAAIFAAWQREASMNAAFFVLFAAGLGMSLRLSQKRRKALVQANRDAAAALAASEGLYYSLFDNMLNGVAFCRMVYQDGQPADFVYLVVNKAFESLTGLKGVVGRKATEVIPGIRETDSALFEIYGRVASTGQHEKFEAYVSAMNMWYEVSVYSPQQDHFVAVFDVITERKLAAVERKAREERFQALFEGASDGIMTLSPGGKLIAVNGAFAKMHGYSTAEMQAMNLADLDPPHVQQLMPERMRRILSGETLVFEVEHYHRDGHLFPLEVSASLLSSGGEKIIQSFHRDITERKHLERTAAEQNALLRRQKAELEQSLDRVKRLEGLISICMYCKKIRSETNAWLRLEQYISEHSDATFSHGICPECLEEQKESLD